MQVLAWNDAIEPVHLSVVGNHGHYAYPEHGHRGYWELTIVRRGVLHHRLNGQVHRQEPGGVALIRAQDVHGLDARGSEIVNLAIDGTLMEPFTALALGGDGLAALDRHPPLIGRLDSAARAAVDHHLLAIERAADRPSLVSAWMAVAGTILHAVLAPSRNSSGPAWFASAMQRLAEARTAVGLTTFRGWCGVSDAHLSRTIRQRCATTLRDLLVQQRLQLASRALLTTARPIAAIAADCGFSTPSLFHRRFRQRFGVSPRAWRANRFS